MDDGQLFVAGHFERFVPNEDGADIANIFI